MESLLDDIIDKSGILDASLSSDRSISAFVMWSQEFVEISYPMNGSNWIKRSDCGSHSQHRWSLYDNELYEVAQLVVKHNSCLKAMFMQPLCRNCEMRHIWRQPCRTPSNVFYILALNDTKICQAYLDPLIISRKTLDRDSLIAYIKHAPKPVYNAKVVKSTLKKRKQIDRLEKEIEHSILVTNRKTLQTRDDFNNILCDDHHEQQDLIQQEQLNFKTFLEQQQYEEQQTVEHTISPKRRRAENIQPSNEQADKIIPAFVFAYLPVLPPLLSEESAQS